MADGERAGSLRACAGRRGSAGSARLAAHHRGDSAASALARRSARRVPGSPAGRGAGNGRPNEVADAWVPPGTDALSPLASRPLSPPPAPRAESRWTPESFAVAGREDTALGFPAYDTAAPGGWPPPPDDPQILDATPPRG